MNRTNARTHKQGNKNFSAERALRGDPPASVSAGWPPMPAPDTDAGGAGGGRFNTKGNKVTNDTDNKLVLKKCRCKCRLCPDCGLSMGITLRQRLITSAKVFKKPMFVTLSIDRIGTTTGRGFPHASDAFDFVAQGRFLSRLMRAAGITQWLWVLEFQSKTGEGWPHWHMIIDVSQYPGGRLPKEKLNKLWSLWRDKWGIGGLDLKRVKLKDRHHTLCYITKYLTKPPGRGWPQWVMKRNCIRLIGSSRNVGRLVASEKSKDAEEYATPEELEKKKKRKKLFPKKRTHKLICERVAVCGCKTTVLQKFTNSDGKVAHRYVGEIHARLKDIVKLSKEEGSPVTIVIKDVPEMGYTWPEFEIHGPNLDLDKIDNWLDGFGYLESVEWDCHVRQEELLQAWDKGVPVARRDRVIAQPRKKVEPARKKEQEENQFYKMENGKIHISAKGYNW